MSAMWNPIAWLLDWHTLGFGGKGGGGSTDTASSRALANIAQQSFSQTDPLRQGLINRYSAFLGVPTTTTTTQPGTTGGVGSKGGGTGVEPTAESAVLRAFGQISPIGRLLAGSRGQQGATTTTTLGPTDPNQLNRLLVQNSPIYGAIKGANETQFDLARQRTLESVPAGGALTDALTDVELGRAASMTGQLGGLASDELDRALGLATGGATQATSGLAAASATESQLAAAQMQSNAAASAAKGQGLGMLGAAAIKSFCWVAREVLRDDRWLVFQRWMVLQSPRWLFDWYASNGPGLAEWLHAHGWARRAVYPAFAWWVRRIDHAAS